MKKIININLSGRVIPIEDTAYEKLQAYIETLRRYFANEESREEIINDIESRIAELLYEKIRKGAETATDADIDEIIASMGTAEDFEAEENENMNAPGTASSTTGQQEQNQRQYADAGTRTGGRLYRDTNDRFIGGVCGGIANYLNVDPTVIRLVFGVIAFGMGIGFLAYIILWIVLPPRDLEGYLGKRLYRNPDNRIIGGVAGGLAAYFGKKASLFRLIFGAPVLFSIFFRILNRMTWHNDFDFAVNIGFGSLTGVFILTYIILWIVLPEANSDYQKMEMRGEKVDVNRIRRNVKEGMNSMKERMKDWGEEVKTTAQHIGTRGKEMAGEFRESSRRRGSGLGHAIGVIFKAFFLFIAGTIAFSLFIALLALLFGGVAWWPINNFLWTSKWQQLFAWGTLILFLIVPLAGFVVWIIRRTMRTRSRSNYLGWTFGGLWAIGWVVMILFVASIFKDFRQYEHADSTILISQQPPGNKMIVAVSQPELEYSGGFGWINDDAEGWDLSSDTLKIAAIKINVNASTDDQYHAVMKKYSFGRTREEAVNRAQKVQYDIVSKDSVLDLGNGYAIDKKSKFRFQNIVLEIYVPVGKKIRFDESIKQKLNSLHIKVQRSEKRNKIYGVEITTNEWDELPYHTNVDYTMGIGGVLIGPDGKAEKIQPSGGYRFENNSDTNNLDEKIKQTEKELNDLKEKKNKKPGMNTIIKGPVQVNKEADVAVGPSPASSLVQYF